MLARFSSSQCIRFTVVYRELSDPHWMGACFGAIEFVCGAFCEAQAPCSVGASEFDVCGAFCDPWSVISIF